MTTPSVTAEEAAAVLGAPPGDLDETVAALPGAPGLYAWWIDPDAVPDLGTGLLVVGAARMLRNRVRRQDLYRTGVSRLRRVLAGLLLDELALAPTWAADVVLPKADEERLSAWMHPRLRLTAQPVDEAAGLLPAVAALLGPAGLESDAAARAEARYVAAAGEKQPLEPGVPFRRP